MARPGWKVRRQQQVRNALELAVGSVIGAAMIFGLPWLLLFACDAMHPGGCR